MKKVILVLFVIYFSIAELQAGNRMLNWIFAADNLGSNTKTGGLGITFMANPDTVVVLNNFGWSGGYYYDASSATRTNNSILLNAHWNLFYIDTQEKFYYSESDNLNNNTLLVNHPYSDNVTFLFRDYGYFSPLQYLTLDNNKLVTGSPKDFIVDSTDLLQPSYYSDIILSGCYHKNRKDVWIVARNPYSDLFLTYKIDKYGVNNTPIESPSGGYTDFNLGHGNPFIDYDGPLLKLSPEGSKILEMYDYQFRIIPFDNASGYVKTNTILKEGLKDSIKNWDDIKCLMLSGEFSPDGSKFYSCVIDSPWFHPGISKIYQYDLNNFNKKTLIKRIEPDSTYDTLAWYGKDLMTSMQLGPDGRIYINKDGSEFLSSINNPNQAGLVCNFRDSSVNMGCRYYSWHLPAMMQGYLQLWAHAASNSPVCYGADIKLMADTMMRAEYKWTGPNGFTSTEISPIIPNADESKIGIYTVRVTRDGQVLYDSVSVKVLKSISADIKGDSILCTGNSAKLEAIASESNCKFLWSTGQLSKEITIKSGGKYWVHVVDANGCESSDTIIVIEHSKPLPDILGPNSVCVNSEEIYNNPDFFNSILNWKVVGGTILSGDGSDSIKVKWGSKGTGIIYITQIDTLSGCVGTDSLVIKIDNILKPLLEPSNIELCSGDNVSVSAPEGYSEYKWNNGPTSREIIIAKAGEYYVWVKDKGGCEGYSDTIHVKEVPKPIAVITGDSLFCPGRTSILLVPNDYQSYHWNTGDTTKSISVTEPGIYSVTVTDTNGCTGSASFEVKFYDIKLTGLTILVFGSRQAGSSYPLNLALKNESNVPIQIKSITAKNPSNIFNITTNPGLQTPLNVGSTIDVTVTFKPDMNQSYSDSLILVIDAPCPDTLSSYLSGTSKAITTIFIPDLTTTVGTPNFCIPLMAKKDANMQIIDNLSYTAEIRYDATVLVPNDSYPIESGDRVISLSGNNIKFINNEIELGNFCGDVVLANKDITPLRITQFKWNNPNIDTITQNGSLTIQGLCQRGIARIELFNPVEFSIKQSIVSNELDITTKNATNEDILTIYSIIGIEMGNYVCSEQMNIDVSGLSSGLYFVRIGDRVGKFVKL